MSDTAADDRAGEERAAYIHIPFCHRRCPYCDFAVVDLVQPSASIDRYVAALVAEIDMEASWEPLHAVNIGGGTPSILTPSQLQRVLARLEDKFGFVAGAEISIEANPEDWTRQHAEQVRAVGVNRVSLGVQSFDDDVLQRLGRAHTPAQGTEAVANAKHAGFDVVNLDLIFGTPGESSDSWQATVATALRLDTNHLSAYALTVERGTQLSRAVAAGAPAPDGDDQADKYELLVAAADGFLRHYEVSNWARPGSECRYNLTTWAQGEYLGFGLGAHSHRAGIRRRNVRRLDAYLDRVEDGRRPIAGTEQQSAWEREKERLFLGLRRRSGVVAGAAGEALLASEAGRRLRSAGVIDLDGNRLTVVEPLLTDAVAREVLVLQSGTG